MTINVTRQNEVLFYNRWDGIKQRCTNPNHPGWKNYGGRGITMHPPWFDYQTFKAAILAELGPPPPDRRAWAFDRKNNNGNYEPGNLRYATRAQQTANRRNVSWITIEGVEYPLHTGLGRLGFDTIRRITVARSIKTSRFPWRTVLERFGRRFKVDVSTVSAVRVSTHSLHDPDKPFD